MQETINIFDGNYSDGYIMSGGGGAHLYQDVNKITSSNI